MAADRPPDRPRGNPYGLLVVGSEMVSFTLLGLFLDLVAFHTLPVFTIGLTVTGLAAAFMQLVRMARSMGKPPTDGQGGQTGGPA
jgi:F0F1-type ATP synthase assembly protein I